MIIDECMHVEKKEAEKQNDSERMPSNMRENLGYIADMDWEKQKEEEEKQQIDIAEVDIGKWVDVLRTDRDTMVHEHKDQEEEKREQKRPGALAVNEICSRSVCRQ